MRRGLVPLALTALALLTSLGSASPTGAQPIARESLPPELHPWVPWVLDAVPGLGCPRVQGRPVCVWPGRLRLDLDGAGGRFALAVHSDRETSLRLPGTAQIWPQDVRVDGRAVPVFGKDGAPRVLSLIHI